MYRTAEAELTRRDLAILRVVARGGAELIAGVEPDLFLDGMYCCDQSAAHFLARAGLIGPAGLATIGQRVPAQLTESGLDALADSAPVRAA